MPTPRVLARSGLCARPLPSAVLARSGLRADAGGAASGAASVDDPVGMPTPSALARSGLARSGAASVGRPTVGRVATQMLA